MMIFAKNQKIILIIIAILFLTHQVTQKALGFSLPLVDSYLDPLLCAPLLLSTVLLERRYLFRRGAAYILSPIETGAAVLLLALAGEVLFPRLSPHFTADAADAAAYLGGGLFFYFFLNWPGKPTATP